MPSYYKKIYIYIEVYARLPIETYIYDIMINCRTCYTFYVSTNEILQFSQKVKAIFSRKIITNWRSNSLSPNSQHKEFLIFTDSLSELQVFENFHSNFFIIRILKYLRRTQRRNLYLLGQKNHVDGTFMELK